MVPPAGPRGRKNTPRSRLSPRKWFRLLEPTGGGTSTPRARVGVGASLRRAGARSRAGHGSGLRAPDASAHRLLLRRDWARWAPPATPGPRRAAAATVTAAAAASTAAAAAASPKLEDDGLRRSEGAGPPHGERTRLGLRWARGCHPASCGTRTPQFCVSGGMASQGSSWESSPVPRLFWSYGRRYVLVGILGLV